MIQTIDVGTVFSPRLTNRDPNQGDGKNTAIEFRTRYLSELDDPQVWLSPTLRIRLDFANVVRLGSSFANEAFGYFVRHARPEAILKVIQFVNTTNVQMTMIEQELRSAASKK